MNPSLFHHGKVQLYAGDCMEVLRELPGNSIDAVCTDPPYHLTSIVKRFSKNGYSKSNLEQPANKKLDGIMAGSFRRLAKGFMGKQWDGGDIAFQPELWAEVLRVLKPGGHMVAFSGTRTYHRMACAIEDARFEIRDQLAFCFGSGFPKSHDISRNLYEVRCGCGSNRAQAEYDVQNMREPDVSSPVHASESESQERGAWNYCDRCGKPIIPDGLGTALKPAWEPICLARKPLSESTVAGNVLKHSVGALNIDATRIPSGKHHADKCASVVGLGSNRTGDVYGEWTGERTDSHSPLGRWPANLCHDGSPEVLAGFPDRDGATSNGASGKAVGYEGGWKGQPQHPGYADTGSAARFFYTAKADADDRLNSKHPTVKPVDLMQWLVRLICPKGGTVLDPFAGTGTTGAAGFIEGRRCVLIEREAEYLADIERRMDLLLSGPDERARKLAKADAHESLPLFGVL